MNNIPIKVIARQLLQDFIGKDAFRGITISYAWLANQFGHFALGFIPATIIYMLHSDKATGNNGIYWPSWVVWGFWLGFEIINFFVSVTKSNKNPIVKKRPEKIFYRSRRWHFIYDTFTDLCFFGLGAAIASLVFAPSGTTIMIAVAFFCLLIPSSYFWYGAKIYLQRALYPFQFRLSQWNRDMSAANKEAVNKFMEAEFSGMQLLVLGEDDDEKIKLCVGIGSEMSYQLKKCRYLTAMKAFECFCRKEATDAADSDKFTWNWHEASLLIIDDINPSHANLQEFVTPGEFLQMIGEYDSERNKKLLREKKVVWMLGNETGEKAEQRGWEDMLVSLGVNRDNILTVNLSDGHPS